MTRFFFNVNVYTISCPSVERQSTCERQSQHVDLVNLFGRSVITVMFPSEYKNTRTALLGTIVMIVNVRFDRPQGQSCRWRPPQNYGHMDLVTLRTVDPAERLPDGSRIPLSIGGGIYARSGTGGISCVATGERVRGASGGWWVPAIKHSPMLSGLSGLEIGLHRSIGLVGGKRPSGCAKARSPAWVGHTATLRDIHHLLKNYPRRCQCRAQGTWRRSRSRRT